MTTTATPSLKQLALGDLDFELANTRRLLERVPGEGHDWAPHEKSMLLGKLASHITNIPLLATYILEHPEWDLGGPRVLPPAPPAASGAELVRHFDANVARLRERLDATSDEALTATWTLRFGDRVIASQPRVVAVRTWGISHQVHHRAQLGVYLRLRGIPLPPTYGPSADER